MSAKPVRDVRHDAGYSYVAVTGCRRASSHHGPSSALLLENGVPLPGPANALHEDIRTLGGGRYSFWHNSVYFSAPDNSDPRTNGRVYSFVVDSSVRSLVLSHLPPALRSRLGRVARGVHHRLVTRSLSCELWRGLYWISFVGVRMRGAVRRFARRLR